MFKVRDYYLPSMEEEFQTLQVTQNAKFLDAAISFGSVVLFFLEKDNLEKEDRTFFLLPTNKPIPEHSAYLKTLRLKNNSEDLHLFSHEV